MTSRVGTKGQVVIPKEVRDLLGIQAGDEVQIWAEGDRAALRRVGDVQALNGRFAGSSLLVELDADRARERLRDDSR
jgi:AbrB family looped-hinge helix DNA binding protein